MRSSASRFAQASISTSPFVRVLRDHRDQPAIVEREGVEVDGERSSVERSLPDGDGSSQAHLDAVLAQ